MLADAFISVNVGELNITLVQITAVAASLSAGATAMWNKTINYLRDRDAREAALQQKLLEMASSLQKFADQFAERTK